MKRANKGFVYLWALFAVTVAGITLAATGQVWQTKLKREKELELLFIGDEFRKAIMSYYNNQLTGVRQYPESLEELLEDKRGPVPVRHLRKMYIDPMTLSDEWGVVKEEHAPQQARRQNNRQNNALGGSNTIGSASVTKRKVIVGVYSLSDRKPLKKGNFPEHFAKFSEAETYQDWQFVHKQDAGGAANKNTNTSRSQQGTSAGAGTSPFGAPGGASGSAQSGSSSPFASPSAPASGQAGQNPFAR